MPLSWRATSAVTSNEEPVGPFVLASFALCRQQRIARVSAPRRDVVFTPRVGRNKLKDLIECDLADGVLGIDDGTGAVSPRGIHDECRFDMFALRRFCCRHLRSPPCLRLLSSTPDRALAQS